MSEKFARVLGLQGKRGTSNTGCPTSVDNIDEYCSKREQGRENYYNTFA